MSEVLASQNCPTVTHQDPGSKAWYPAIGTLVISHQNLPSGNLTKLLKMAIEIVDFPIKNGDFP